MLGNNGYNRITYDEVRNYFELNGCVLLEDKYINAKTKMKYICCCGKESKIRYYSFKLGNRCKFCGNTKNSERQKYTQEQAEMKFIKCGCELLDSYKGASKIVKCKCECGELYYARPNNIWRGKRCKKCFVEKNK